jgi:glycosyltransferase involved in cell wall biosynthesis
VPNIHFIQHVRVGPSRAKILLDVLLFFKAIQRLLVKRYDVIHSNEEAAFFGMFLAWIFQTRHLYDMHSQLSKQLEKSDFGNMSFIVKIFKLLEKMVLKTCDAVITVGPDLEAYVKSVKPDINVTMIENIALHAYESQVLPETVEQLRQSLNLDGRLPIIYTGTYERYQGLDMALDCVKLVTKQFPNAIFIFVGAKNKQAWEWTEKALAMDLVDHTLFLDVVPPEESMVFLAYASVLLSPRLDGTTTPLKIYSYLYSGKPIVATNINAHTQVLDEDTAVLVEPNKEAFAEGIIRVLKDPELAERLGKNANQYAREKFDFKTYMAKVFEIYDDILLKEKKEKPVLARER